MAGRSDEEMKGVIQRISTIKHAPMHFWISPFDLSTWASIAGPRAFLLGTLGAIAAVFHHGSYAIHNKISAPHFRYGLFWRMGLCFTVGFGYGFHQWGDLQRLHNAYVAERLMRRYPESEALKFEGLASVEGKEPKHLFYKWN